MVDTTLDRDGLAGFLRGRRESLQPEDVGLRRGTRRRTAGLRREEVAELCDMSADYLARLERGGGSQPSQQMAAAIARGLRLTPDERDHLFLLCGHRLQTRQLREAHISPGLLRVMDRLQDTPSQIMGPVGETLQQTPPAVALLGDETRHTGPARSALYRWFTDPAAARHRYLPDDHDLHSRVYVAVLRASATAQGPGSPAASLVADLQHNKEFAELWNRQEVGLRWSSAKRFVHPEVGRIDLYCQTLLDPDQGQSLLIFTATPGTESHDRLALLTVLGADTFTGS
ncbi:transcriptional regulator with XRE-family HTH domain [Streptomyces sp. LBL]|uniref:helix-turn-helix transcriptional regulator n=1 Tax=Streptomyces sp. LBL TaxID=2940562 RepID=UPI00247550BA|nr:helix-turn-helix transcriptional regulator [Streptomyces sp. LBL]MDH6622972.1 transcriptional regulator with XRE-family HTH domain [Streptomyces sp. LBL]